MNKTLIWFHSFPNTSEVIDDELWFDRVRVTAFQTASEKHKARKLFAGNFSGLSEFISGQSNIAGIEIVLPAKEVLYTQVSIPSKSRKRLMQAIPFILEDNLIKNIDNQFFALGDVINGLCNIAVVNRSIIEKIFNQFKKLSVSVSMMSSEIFLLPWQPDQWSITFLQDEILIRTGAQSGITFNRLNAEFMFQLLLSKTDSQDNNLPESMVIFAPGDSELTETIQLLAQSYAIGVRVEDADLLSLALKNSGSTSKAHEISDHKRINLLQGEFNPANIKSIKIPFKKSLAAAVIIAILSQIAFMTFQWQYAKQELEQAKIDLEQLYFKTFPESKRLQNVRLQTEDKLKQLQQGAYANDSFLNLLGIVGQELRQINHIKIQNIRYVDGILQLDLRSKNFVFGQLKASIQDKHGLLVEEKSSSKIKNEVQTVVNFRLSNS